MQKEHLSHELFHALENETNSSILDLTTSIIKEHKNNILQKMQFKGKQLKELHKKLKNYRYVRDMNDLQYGYFIRWFSLKNPDNLKLTNGGYIVTIDIINNQIQIRVRNFMNRIFQIKFDECVIFQKITDQEKVILGILDYLQ